MPPKKNKNAPRNPFYFYMVSLRPQLERQGVVLENGMQTLAELAGPRWKDLPEHEKEVYQEMARQAKANRRQGASRNDRMDCTGELISKRVDTVSLNESKRRRQREEVRSMWPPGRLVCDERFFLIGFMTLLPEGPDVLPCEVGVAEFTLNGGILRTMHKFIRPGDIPLGYRYTAMSNSDKYHKIPLGGLAKEEDTYQRIWLDIIKFVNPEGQTAFPPVYSRGSETGQTEACLDWLARNTGNPNRLKKVYELEGLICDLYSHISPHTDHTGISKAQATDLISTSVFDFEPGARCDWHEDQEIKFCALGTAKRYCYCIADFLCPRYGIALTPSHVPERPEGTFCTPLNAGPPVVNHNRAGGRSWAAETEDNGPFAARDYRYKGMRAAPTSNGTGDDVKSTGSPYQRSGPTYDMQSLQRRDEQQPSRQQQEQEFLQQQRLQQQQRQQQQQQFAQGSSASVVTPMGRGRGRGRGAAINQPLRRPNVPGMAPAAAGVHGIGAPPMTGPPGRGIPPPVAGRGIPPQPAGRGSPAPGPWGEVDNFQADPRQSDIPSWAMMTGAGRGANRAPTSKPKVYAGAANAPHPSFAPPPPLAWQQDQFQQQPGKNEDWPQLGMNGQNMNNGDMLNMVAQMNMRDYY